jgi:branched-chain amino acid aminotransferase
MTAATVLTWRLDARDLPLLSFEPAPRSLDEASRHLPSGVYTTFRTYAERTRVVGLRAHLDRLDDSAARSARARTPPVDRSAIRAALRAALGSFGSGEARVRLTLSLADPPGAVFLSIQPLQPPPPEIYTCGVRVRISGLRRSAPEVKATDFLTAAAPQRAALPAGVFELLLVDEAGSILECTSSNFFGVLAGRLWTAGTGVLAGVTRGVVLDLARQAGLDVVLQPVPRSAIPELSEAFLTSSSRGVVPIVGIDEHPVGEGVPGPVSRRLGELYEQRLLAYAEPIFED